MKEPEHTPTLWLFVEVWSYEQQDALIKSQALLEQITMLSFKLSIQVPVIIQLHALPPRVNKLPFMGAVVILAFLARVKRSVVLPWVG